MKKLILILSTILALSNCKQNNSDEPVPEIIKKAFDKIHPNAVILKWNDESPVWEAKYKEGAEVGAVSFDANGSVTETELVIAKEQLPDGSAIPDYIATNYPKEKIQSCEKITLANGTVTYEIQITGKELVFDQAGNFLEEEKD